MGGSDYEVLRRDVCDEGAAPRGPNVYYRCRKCGVVIPSQPEDNVGCECGNVFIDVDYHRLIVKDFSDLEVVRPVEK